MGCSTASFQRSKFLGCLLDNIHRETIYGPTKQQSCAFKTAATGTWKLKGYSVLGNGPCYMTAIQLQHKCYTVGTCHIVSQNVFTGRVNICAVQQSRQSWSYSWSQSPVLVQFTGKPKYSQSHNQLTATISTFSMLIAYLNYRIQVSSIIRNVVINFTVYSKCSSI